MQAGSMSISPSLGQWQLETTMTVRMFPYAELKKMINLSQRLQRCFCIQEPK